MPIVISDEIITEVNRTLNDKGFFRWPKDELLGYLNKAQKAIVIRRPDAYYIDTDDFTCVVGTKQTLPDNALQLIEVNRNASGVVIIGPYDKKELDNDYPNWHQGVKAINAEFYLYDRRYPKTLYLYPGVVAGSKVNAVYSVAPPIITMAQNDLDQVIALDDVYENAIMEWMLYRCYSKDAEYAANPNKAIMHLNAFKSQLGEKTQADSAMTKETIKGN